jgi:periplasmic protein CpxP/Spy
MKKHLLLLPGVIALVLGVAPVIPIFTNSAVAADAQPGKVDRERAKSNKLNLTDAQKAQRSQIRESSRQQMDAILTPEQKEKLRMARQQKQKPNLNLTEDQKAKIKAIRANTKAQIDAILTPEQRQKHQEMRSSWRDKHQQNQSK